MEWLTTFKKSLNQSRQCAELRSLGVNDEQSLAIVYGDEEARKIQEGLMTESMKKEIEKLKK